MDKTQLAKQIGKKIAEAREGIGLSRADVGNRLGLSERGYGHIEAGRSLITLDHLLQLPRILYKPLTFFLPHAFTEAELNDLTHDPLLQEFIAAWPHLTPDERRAFVHLAKKGVKRSPNSSAAKSDKNVTVLQPSCFSRKSVV